MVKFEDRDVSNVPDIPEFYKGKNIFMTGGTGFLGQALVEKLLYSCSDLERIYLLMRPKRGVSVEDRLKKLYESTCFLRLKKERPGLFESKVTACAGDIAELGLGLSAEDRALIVNRVDIVIHGAATVRFDSPLQESAIYNLRGTREILELATEIKNLCAFMYISTAYTNTDRNSVGEMMYPPKADWKTILDICDNVDPDTLQILTPKLLGSYPNTYTFTKHLSEHLVYEYNGKLPAVIIRPSIVIFPEQEPMPGWINNINGPMGIILATGKGVLRSVYVNEGLSLDQIPLDVVVKHIIVATWTRGSEALKPTDDLPIYNCCSNDLMKIPMSVLHKCGMKFTKDYPLANSLWVPNMALTDSLFLHNLNVILWQLIPAMLVDTILWLLGKKPLLLKVQRKIYNSSSALRFFMTHNWTFHHNNFLSLRTQIKERDREQFYYDLENLNVEDYLHKSLLGGMIYYLNEKIEDMPKNKAILRKMKIVDTIAKAIFYVALFWIIFNSKYAKSLYTYLTNCLY